MIDWSFTETKAASTALDGPTQIVSGRGCRLNLKTVSDVATRNDDLVRRLYRVVVILAKQQPDNFRADPCDGFTRVFGGEPPYYVRGTSQPDVITTIGKALISADKSAQDEIAKLGVTALVEW